MDGPNSAIIFFRLLWLELSMSADSFITVNEANPLKESEQGNVKTEMQKLSNDY